MRITVPLKGNRDFRRIYSRAHSFVSRSVVLYFSKNRLGSNRLGITVSKKLGCAVKRNRAKRIIREAYRMTEPEIRRGYDFVVVARSRALSMKTGELQKDLYTVLKNAGVLLK
ncbi:MAG TPA: ribonuclease P protein component [Clostridia bacterium]|nr:ribonuclease P protein component [Clostridia bacterium]